MGTRDVTISAELLVDILTEGDVTDASSRIKCVQGLPVDASLVAASCRSVGVGREPDLLLTFRSHEWEGHEELTVMYERQERPTPPSNRETRDGVPNP